MSNQLNSGQDARPARTPQTEAVLDRLRAQLPPEQAPAWVAEPGDELVGWFETWTSAPTQYDDEPQPIAVIETHGTGERVWVWLTYTVLRDVMLRAAPEPGDLVLIRREEDRESKTGQGYRYYRVAVDREAENNREWSQPQPDLPLHNEKDPT